MSQHGCPERLSNRPKSFQEEEANQPTMEVLVETLTGTAFEMTVSPSDTIFAIKSKIYRVEGIPISQQHLLYNMKELDDECSLDELDITDGASLRLVLGMRGGPISTRRLPPPAPITSEPWPDIETLLESNRDEVECSTSGYKMSVLVFREGERVNMMRVRENEDGTYSPIDSNKRSRRSSVSERTGARVEPRAEPEGGGGVLQENAVTMGKMLDLRRRMEAMSLNRTYSRPDNEVEIQKTRSEETLSRSRPLLQTVPYSRYSEPKDCFEPLSHDNCSRYEMERGGFNDLYTLLPPIAATSDSDQSVDSTDRPVHRQGRKEDSALLEKRRAAGECLRQDSLAAGPGHDYGPLVTEGAWCGAHSASASALPRGAALPPPEPLSQAMFSSSASELQSASSRMLPPLSRHWPRQHLHLSDEELHLPPAPPAPPALPALTAPPRRHLRTPALKKIRIRCSVCKKRLSISTVHQCRCGAQFCASHRYAEEHGCSYDYKAEPHSLLAYATTYRPDKNLPRF